jgi:predicted  nucleic acid-binding Zn-ribbon protein
MSKKRKSVTIDESLARQIDQRNEINFSSLVNDLVEHYFAGDATAHKTKTALKVQLQHVQDEIEQKEERLRQLRKREEELEQLIEEHEDQQDPLVEEALEVLQDLPDDKLHAENDAVINWASKIGISPAKLVELVKNERY